MTFDALQIFLIALVGLGGGLIGGVAGLGGSVLILPGLAIVLGYADESRADEHHLYMASAMITNIVVALGATRRHWRNKNIDRRTVLLLLPALLPAITVGALLSDHLPGAALKVGLGVLILAGQVAAILRDRYAPSAEPDRPAPVPATVATGGATGLAAGLLGVGGGVVAVTCLRCLARMPIKRAVAASSAAMCISAVVGASVKTWNLPSHGFEPVQAVWIAAIMGVGALLGGSMGAHLVHRLPEPVVRWGVTLLLVLIAVRLILPAFA